MLGGQRYSLPCDRGELPVWCLISQSICALPDSELSKGERL